MKTNHVNNAGPARWKQLAHGRFRPARPERKEERGGLAGLRPTAALPGRPGWLAKAEDSPVRARGRDGAARPAAIIGRARASERAQEVREAMENAGRQLSMAEKGRKGTFHGGRARWRHGRRRRSLEQALPWLKRRHNREHQVSESEAELLALGIGE